MTGDNRLHVQETVTMTESVRITKRSYYSIGWLTSAEIMRKQAELIGGGSEHPEAPDYDKMRACVLSAVTSAGAFLEAHINELFGDSVEHLDKLPYAEAQGMERETQVRMAALWPHIERSVGVLPKYQIALDLAEAAPLPSGEEPGQSAADVLRIRNYYLHYKPESATDGIVEGTDKKLSENMSGKITLPAWDRGGQDLFPDRVLCPDLARWALAAAVRYSDSFCDRLGIARLYEHVRPAWLT